MAPPSTRRFDLYRTAGRALDRFYSRWTKRFCAACLDVTRVHHRGDPRADVDLLDGFFPGCCHAGVGDALWVPGTADERRFPPQLKRLMEQARSEAAPGPRAPAEYTVRERKTGFVARGVGCVYLGPDGCRLGNLKSPLCLTYLCDAVRGALASIAGWDLVGQDSDDFCGTRTTLRTIVKGRIRFAELQVNGLRVRLGRLSRALASWEVETGRVVGPATDESGAGRERWNAGRAI